MGLEYIKLPSDCRGMSQEEYFACRDKSINDLKAYKRGVHREKYSLEIKLEEHRDDFAVIESQELLLAQIVAVLANNTYLLKCMKTSKNNLDELCAGDEQIRGINDLLDMDYVYGSLCNDVDMENEDYITKITDKGKEFDELRTEIAQAIEEIKRQITVCDMKIDEANNMLSLWGYGV